MNQTRDWRAKPAGQTGSTTSRPARLAFLTFLGLALGGVFVWAIWGYIFPKPALYFAYLPVSDYKTLAADPLGFQVEDAAAFRQAVEQVPTGQFQHLDAHSEVRDMRTLLEDQLRAAVADSRGRLVLVVSAHGLAVEGEAYLLGSDYDPLAASGKSGMLPVAELLNQLAGSTAPLKLLILESGALPPAAARGLAVNEFAPALADAVKAVPDPQLWVFHSHGLWERSHRSLADRYSVFGHYVAEAIAGAADGNSDGRLELSELQPYVTEKVGAWVWNATGRLEPQTPQLLRGGSGEVTKDVPLALYLAEGFRQWSPPEPAAAETETEKAAESEPKTEDATKADTGAKTAQSWRRQTLSAVLFAQTPPPGGGGLGSAGQPAAGAKSEAQDPAPTSAGDPAPAPQPADGKASPKSDKDAPPTDASKPPAGEESDKTAKDGAPATTTDDTAKTDGGTKVEGAPSKDKSKAAGGSDKAPPPVFAKAADFEERWNRVRQWDQPSAEGWRAADYAPHLWRRYLEELVHAERVARNQDQIPLRMPAASLAAEIDAAGLAFVGGGTCASLDQAELRTAVQSRNLAWDRLRGYLDWYSHGPLGGAAQAGLEQRVPELLTGLEDMQAALVRCVDSPPQSLKDADAFLDELNTSELELTGRLSACQSILETELTLLTSEPQRVVGMAVRAEALLTIGWLSAEQREHLWRQALSAPASSATVAPATAAAAAARRNTAERVGRWLEWETRLASLTESSLPAANAVSAAAADSRLADFRAAAARLAAVYEKLPATLEGRLAEQNGFEADLALRTADALRVPAVVKALGKNVGASPLVDLPLITFGDGVPPALQLTGPSAGGASNGEIVLSRRRPQEVQFQLKYTSLRAVRGSVVLKFDEERLQVSRDGKPVRSNVADPGGVILGSEEGTSDLKYVVQARTEESDGRRVTLEASVSVGTAIDTAKIELMLPGPGRAELTVSTPLNAELLSTAGRGGQAVVAVPIYPGHPTPMKLAVQNPNGEAKQVRFTLAALPRPSASEAANPNWVWRRIESDGVDELLREAKILATDVSLDFKDGDKELPLAIPPPMPPAAGAEPADPPAPVAAPPLAPGEVPDPPGTPIHEGLLCVLVDASREPAERQQVTWIQPRVLHPSDLGVAPVVRYLRGRNQLNIQVAAEDPGRLPPGKTAVIWDWQRSDPALAGAKKTASGELTRRTPSLDLYAEIPPDENRQFYVQLDVGGYPRAFVYRVICDGPGNACVLLRNEYLDLKLLRPLDETAFGNLAELKVDLEVDGPAEFERDQWTVEVQVGPDDQEPRRHVFRADRRFLAWLVVKEAPGQFEINPQVKDLSVTLDTRAYENQPIPVRARLLKAKRPERQEQRTVYFDPVPPEIVFTDDKFAIEAGQGFVGTVTVTDVRGSGVERVEVGLESDDSGEIKDPIKNAVTPDGRGQYRIKLAKESLLEGRYVLLVRARDRAGNQTPPPQKKMIIQVNPPPPPDNTNDLIVDVVYGGERIAGATVVLKRVNSTKTQKTNKDGRTVFMDLEPGTYTLTAQGDAKGQERRTREEATVEVMAPPAKPAMPDPLELR